jgi:tRNA (pseudouridine54-N1)-methyltransferase
MARGTLPLNDLAGAGGRFDVLVRATTAALLTSHGLREDVEVVLHLNGGPGPPRRLRLRGAALRGLHADERSAAGFLGRALTQPQRPRGQWVEVAPGFDDGGGTLSDTLREWSEATVLVLDAAAPPLQQVVHMLSAEGRDDDLAFVLSDDQPLGDEDLSDTMLRASLGTRWMQGHAAVHVVQWLLDQHRS